MKHRRRTEEPDCGESKLLPSRSSTPITPRMSASVQRSACKPERICRLEGLSEIDGPGAKRHPKRSETRSSRICLPVFVPSKHSSLPVPVAVRIHFVVRIPRTVERHLSHRRGGMISELKAAQKASLPANAPEQAGRSMSRRNLPGRSEFAQSQWASPMATYSRCRR